MATNTRIVTLTAHDAVGARTMSRISQVSPWLGQAEQDAAARVIASNWLTEGAESEAFTAALCALLEAPHGVLAPNGTLALVLGLLALGVGAGAEVLVPDATFVASANAVILVGATPVFVDVEPGAFQIDLDHAARLVGPKTRAIMPVHLFGATCDMDSLLAFAARHHLKVIEDAAQALGSTYRGRPVGSLGDVGCFSFFADKTITTGEGGFVACRDPAVHDRLRTLRNHGRFNRGGFDHPQIGYNLRMTDMQAAIGLAQLDRLPAILARKTAIHARYTQRLADLSSIRVLGPGHAERFAPYRAVLMTPDAAGLMRHLEARDIETRGFFQPLHRQPCFQDWPAGLGRRPYLDDADFPNALQGFRQGVCLPIYPSLTDDQVERICDAITAFSAA